MSSPTLPLRPEVSDKPTTTGFIRRHGTATKMSTWFQSVAGIGAAGALSVLAAKSSIFPSTVASFCSNVTELDSKYKLFTIASTMAVAGAAGSLACWAGRRYGKDAEVTKTEGGEKSDKTDGDELRAVHLPGNNLNDKA